VTIRATAVDKRREPLAPRRKALRRDAKLSRRAPPIRRGAIVKPLAKPRKSLSDWTLGVYRSPPPAAAPSLRGAAELCEKRAQGALRALSASRPTVSGGREHSGAEDGLRSRARSSVERGESGRVRKQARSAAP